MDEWCSCAAGGMHLCHAGKLAAEWKMSLVLLRLVGQCSGCSLPGVVMVVATGATPHHTNQIDEVIRQRSSSICYLLSLEKNVGPCDMNSGNYHHFVRQFAGDGSPEVDDTFVTSHEIRATEGVRAYP